MIPQFSNNLLAAVFLYSAYRSVQYPAAFGTLTTRLYPTVDNTLPTGWQGYSAPLKAWNFDSGISGATVINCVSGGGYSAPLTRNSGIHIDYVNGRVLVPTSLGTNLVLTGSYTYTQVNSYLSNEDDSPLVTQGKYFVNPTFRSNLTTSGIAPYVFATPCLFINPLSSKNDPFTFGGLVNTRSTYTLMVFAENNFQLNAIFSTFADAAQGYFPMLNTLDAPLDEWGDLKSGIGYNYVGLCQKWGTQGNLIYVANVRTARVSDRVANRMNLNTQLYAGIIDLDLEYVRQAPVTTNIFV